jgi:acyl carrier protein
VTNEDILNVFTRIVRDLLGDESIVLAMETKREDVPGWDSFNYVNFIAVAEIQLGVKFKVSEVESFENIGAIVIQTKKMLDK